MEIEQAELAVGLNKPDTLDQPKLYLLPLINER